MKRYLVLILISLILILTGVLAGIWFPPHSKDSSLNLSSRQKSNISLEEINISTSDSERLALERWQVDSAILLQATPPETGEQPPFALTTEAIEYELSKHNEALPTHFTCTEENDTPAPDHSGERVSKLERLAEWINSLSFDDQYQVILWSPAGEIDSYILAADDAEHPAKDSTITPVTCRERT